MARLQGAQPPKHSSHPCLFAKLHIRGLEWLVLGTLQQHQWHDIDAHNALAHEGRNIANNGTRVGGRGQEGTRAARDIGRKGHGQEGTRAVRDMGRKGHGHHAANANFDGCLGSMGAVF
eukprot:365743-Chlamydomonas_euryale.AAC.5